LISKRKSKIIALGFIAESATIILLIGFHLYNFPDKEFEIYEEKGSPYSYSYRLGFKASQTYGAIQLENDGSLANIAFKDKRGRVINISYRRSDITRFFIADEEVNYWLSSGVQENNEGNKVIFRQESYLGNMKVYTIDYSATPFFSELNKNFIPADPVN
jgi:hypothetical protein